MRRADAQGLRESHARKIGRKSFVLGDVHLVDDKDRRARRPAKPLGKLKIQRCGTSLAIDDEEQEVGSFNSGPRSLLSEP